MKIKIIMDDAEVHYDTLFHFTWTFDANTVKVVIDDTININTISSEWQLTNNGQDIAMLGSLFHIDKLTNTDLILNDSTNSRILKWQILKKQ